MNIALATDSNYIVPISVVLQSIFAHHNSIVNIYLCYLENSLSDKDITYYSTLVNSNTCTFHPIMISKKHLAKLPNTRHGKAALLRLYLPLLLPNINKILYLDGDIVVNDNLTDLYNIELGENYIAASKDTSPIYHPNHIKKLGINTKHWYFNSGVTLMNLKAFRQINLIENINQYAKLYFSEISSPDQDILNYICQGHTIYIHPRYNMNYSVEKDVAEQTWGREQIKEAKYSPAIIHYIGPIKPWSVLCIHPQRELWWKALKDTPFKNFKPKDACFKNYVRKIYVWAFKQIEDKFTLERKRRFGKIIPLKLKIITKRLVMKPINQEI